MMKSYSLVRGKANMGSGCNDFTIDFGWDTKTTRKSICFKEFFQIKNRSKLIYIDMSTDMYIYVCMCR
jgi:hypothetical protein